MMRIVFKHKKSFSSCEDARGANRDAGASSIGTGSFKALARKAVRQPLVRFNGCVSVYFYRYF